MFKKIILFPYGGNAREALAAIHDINKKALHWDVVGFIDDEPSTHGQQSQGIKVIGGREALKKHENAHVLAVPGNSKDFKNRKRIIDSLKVEPRQWATVIHPSAIIATDAVIGENCLIMGHVVISSGVKLGSHCIILPNTVISHDVVIEEYCCIGSNVSVSGYVHIKAESYIGSGVSIKERIKVGQQALIGIGSTVIRDVPDSKVVVGNPAKEIRS